MALVSNSPDTTPEKRTGFTFRGNEIVLSKTRGRPMTGIKKREGWYPDEKRIEVASLFACLGDAVVVGELAKVPPATVKTWRNQDWFKTLLEEIRDENNQKLDAKFTEIVQKCQEQILDRLEHGDCVLLRDGTEVRKKINAKELALVGAITVDKRQIIRNKPTSISQSVNSEGISDDKLKQLAKTFIELVNKQEIKTINGEFREVKSDETLLG
jgi:hypothetical protein